MCGAYGIIASQIPRSLLLRAAFDIGYNLSRDT